MRDRWNRLANHESEWLIGSPAHSAINRPITPMTVASVIRPLRHTYIHMPMNMPSGMVMATVKVPHTLSASALTNATPRPASATTRIRMIVIAATGP